MQQKLKHILTYARNFCKGIRLTQARNFAALCWAIFRKRTTVLSELARCFVRPRRHIHRLKRIWRFVSNLHFNFRAAAKPIHKSSPGAGPARLPVQSNDWRQLYTSSKLGRSDRQRAITVSRDTYSAGPSQPPVHLSKHAILLLVAHDVR